MKNEEWASDFLKGVDLKGLKRSVKTYIPFHEKIIWKDLELVNFSSNNYLNISFAESVVSEACEAVKKYGTGSLASRLVTGTLPLHEQLELILAKLKGYESSIIFGSGFLANHGIITSVVGRNDIVIADRLVHASIIDAIKTSGANLRRFRHNDPFDLERILSDSYLKNAKKLIVTEAVFSMDGDVAPLEDIANIAERYGAMLLVDEAHSTGIFGENGSGLVSELGLQEKVNFAMGTFSKALGSYGGFTACSSVMKDYFINTARSFIYSTSLPPSVIAASIESLKYIAENKNLGKDLIANATYFRGKLSRAGFDTLNSKTQIVPILIGDSDLAVRFSEKLKEVGLLAVAIRPPTVPVDTARLRFSVTLAHSRKILDESVQKILYVAESLGIV